MKNTFLFKILVDTLYFLHLIGLLGIFFIVPFGIVNINQVKVPVEDWGLLFWLIATLSLCAYIIFLIGLFYLRKTARFLLTHNYFSESIINNLKKSGKHFLLTGICSLVISSILWVNTLYKGKIELVYNLSLFIPLFLMIIGIFFIIQSNALALAKNINDENELTV